MPTQLNYSITMTLSSVDAYSQRKTIARSHRHHKVNDCHPPQVMLSTNEGYDRIVLDHRDVTLIQSVSLRLHANHA